MDGNNRIDGIREPSPQADSRLKPENIIFRRTENLIKRENFDSSGSNKPLLLY